MKLLQALFPVLLGCALDLLIGDPHALPHPVRLIGRLIAGGEALLRRIFPKTPRGEIAAGGVLASVVLAVCWCVPALLLAGAAHVHPWLRIALESVFCCQILAARSLRDESMRVYRSLAAGDLQGARKWLSYIVGRDTAQLDEAHVARAAVETVAENTSDGVVAPLFFLMLGGAPLGFLYKGVNTMDSMLGYKNERYLYFGRIPARLDDVFNFLPAILSAWMMILASLILRMDAKNALRIYRRDHRNHASPNSARTESVCAGALGLQLGGDASYFGVMHHKKTIGDPLRAVEPEDIRRANRLMFGTALCALALLCACRWGVWLL